LELVVSAAYSRIMSFLYYGDTWLVLLSLAVGIIGVGALIASTSRFKLRNFDLGSKAALPLARDVITTTTDPTIRRHPFLRKKLTEADPDKLKDAHKIISEKKIHSSAALANLLSLIAISGDFTMILLGFILANLLCQSHWASAGLGSQAMPSVAQSYKLILCGSLIVFWALAGKEMYQIKNLLRPSRIWHKFISPLFLCLLAFIIFDMGVRTDPPIPWLFFVCAALIVFMNIWMWHIMLSKIIHRLPIFARLRRRLVVIGGGSQTMQIKKALGDHSDMEFVGWVQAIRPNPIPALDKHRLGPLHELGSILKKNAADVVVLTESENLQREGVLAVAKACENEHVQFKMVPHFFDILVSHLRPDRIGEIQLLGVDSLPLSGYRNRVAKRSIDILGALVGLCLAAPMILIFGGLVYWESPGPILFKQIRQGRNGQLFYIIKIRSMQMNAEVHGKPKWAQPNDQRRLRIGSFMRKWNIDEVPQFWNVLIGEMSLVGPRPERPELIARFKSKFPHYQARHMCRPGMTGWAQVNGWRGNTDLEERIRHDIWYLENWSVWLDLRIMFQTFFKRENAY